MKAKILITTFTFPPNKDGVAEAARSMAYGLADSGYEVIVATGYLPERTNFEPHPGVRVEQFDVISNWKFVGKSLEEKERMRQFILNEQPAVILCHCWEIWSTATAEETFNELGSTGKILISHGYTTHQWRPNPTPPFGLGVLLRSLPKVLGLPFTLRRYDRVVFLSHRPDWQRFFDLKIAKISRYDGIRVIPNGTERNPDRGNIEDFRQRYELGNGFTALCVANYGPRKNQELAIRAFRRARIPGSNLVLIGSELNDYAKSIMELDKKLGLEFPEGRVVFIEKLDRKSTLAAYSACDVFLLAALAETQPIAILEAMAAGIPFISTPTGCVREMAGGMIAEGEDCLAHALVELHQNPAKRIQMGKTGRDAVEQYYSKDKVWDAYKTLIKEVLRKA